MKDIKSILASSNLTDEQKASIEKALKTQSRRKDASELEAKHPHMVKGSLGFDEVAKKQTATVKCTVPGCSETRQVFTSDLFQVKVCEGHKKESRKQARAERREEGKRALALLRSLEAETVKQ